MADVAKSDEIEDVLSSIRRLVSDHQPPAASSPVGSPEVGDTPDRAQPVSTLAEGGGSRLLLTPALRVTDPEDPWVPITPRAEVAEAPAGPAPDDSQTEDNAVSRDDGADWARALWAEDNESSPENTLQEEQAARHAPDPQLQADEWEARDEQGRDPVPSTADDGLTDPVDVTEAILHDVAQAAAAEPDVEDIADVPLSFIRSTSSVSDYEPEEDNDALTSGPPPAPTLELAEARASQEVPDTPIVKVEILRAADCAETRDDPHGSMAEGSDTAAEPAPSQEVTEQVEKDRPQSEEDAEVSDQPPHDQEIDFLEDLPEPPAPPDEAAEAVEDLGEAPFTFPDASDDFVDEDALREIIAEVVREELQGDMGVRITRNVRKLVRREIRLALAARDIE